MKLQKNNMTALYIRVSTEAQAEEGYSIGAQTERLTAYCRMKDIMHFETFVDGGFSGSNLDRPAMRELIQAAQAGNLERVVVYKLDRLSRSQKDTLYLIEDVFLPHAVEFVSINENIDTGTPYGRAMVGILSAFAQLERENIFQRTRMGMLERVKSGLWPGGGKPPFGYDYDTTSGRLIPNADAPKVGEMYRLYREGWSPQRLAEAFGLPHTNQAAQILSHAVYTGVVPYKGQEYPGKHEPIVSRALFEQVQQARKARAVRPAASGGYLLTGLLVCGSCGAKMRYQQWGKAGAKLVCYSRDRSKAHLVHDPHCNNRGVMAKEVERAVIADLKRLSVALPEETAWQEDETVLLERLSDRQQRRLRRLYALYAEQEDEALRETIAHTRAELERLCAEKAACAQAAHVAKRDRQAISRLRLLKNDWPHLTLQEQREIVRACVDKIVLTQDSVDIYYSLAVTQVQPAQAV